MRVPKKTWFNSLLLLLVILGMACGDDKTSDNNVSVSFAGDIPPLLTKGLKKSASHVTIDTAKILIKSIKLDGSGPSDSSDFKTGPYVLFMTEGASLKTLSATNVPEGEYDQVKFEIHLPSQNESVPDPDFRDGSGGNERYSAVIIGHYNGIRFVFKSKSTVNVQSDISPSVIVADSVGTANLTLGVSTSIWFTDGEVNLDPTNTNASNVAKIEQSIRNSFYGFRDNNKDGDADVQIER